VADSLRWAGRTAVGRVRRNEVVRLLGLAWSSEERTWRKEDNLA
jgi:hypothetical protein